MTATLEIDPGTIEIKVAKDLMVIRPIQRTPTERRIREMAENWDESKVGILLVAKITDGEHKGRLHIYDGGTRWKAQMEHGSELYPFTCWVRKMTMAEAAEKFLDHNSLSMKPSAFSRFSVGVRAGKPEALAIQRALTKLKIEASETRDSSPKTFIAFAAAERIVKREYRESEDWDSASDILIWCLSMARTAFSHPGEPYFGHDADLIQGLAAIHSYNRGITGDDEAQTNLIHAMTTWLGKGSMKERLYHYGDVLNPSHWRIVVLDATRNTGGSSSRGIQMGRQIALNYNQAFTPLTAPPAAARK